MVEAIVSFLVRCQNSYRRLYFIAVLASDASDRFVVELPLMRNIFALDRKPWITSEISRELKSSIKKT